MVKIWSSVDDGLFHYLMDKEPMFDMVLSLFKENHLQYCPSDKSWAIEPNLTALNLYKELKTLTKVEISNDDLEMFSCTTYPPSDEIKKVKYSIDKELLELNPPLKGIDGKEDYQLQAIKRVVTTNRAFLNLAPRLGKAYISILGLGSLMKLNQVDCVLAIMRSEGLVNYKSEILRFLPFIDENDIVILNKDCRNIEDFFDKKFILMSYNTWRLVNEFYKKERKITSKRPRSTIIKFNNWFEKKALILDECQSVCNDSLQSYYTILHSEFFQRRYCMSGSIGYDLEKLYNIAKILTPNRINMSRSSWWNYVTTEGWSRYNRVIIPERMKEFQDEIMNPLTITFDENCLPHTDVFYDMIYVDMTDKMKKNYQNICNDFLIQLKNEGKKITFKNLKMKFPYLKQATDDMSLMDVANWNMEKDNPKIEVLNSFLEQKIENENKKVILWCNYPRTMQKLHDIYKKYNPICVSGDERLCGVKRSERSEVIEDIKTSKDCKLLICNSVLSTSVSFWQFSVNCWFSLPMDSDYYIQANKRIQGIGQKKTVEVYHLMISNSIDNYLYEMLTNKINTKKYFDSDEELPMNKLKEILNPKKRFYINGSVRN